MPAIELDGLTFQYRGESEPAIDDVSLTVERGEFLGIAGETGVGKTTLLKSICGIIPFQEAGTREGSVVVDSKRVIDAESVDQLAPTVSMILQNPESQLFNLRVFDEIIWGPENLEMDREEIVRRGEEAMELFGLEGFGDRITYNLSGGEKQKVAIASVYAMNPDIILLDEPTSQLDPIGTEMVFDAIDRLVDEGVTIVMVEHKIEELAEYADRIALLEDGSVTRLDETRSFFTDTTVEHARPQVTQLGMQLNETGVADVDVPLTQDEAVVEYDALLGEP
ncbi:energy-coupling factor ABC transporter ATP-binding protein [Halarchaeum nitratireducens]|uniref:ABC transporter ATP-binding protein n=1 Tax=Halarchaeum nitratireducens TaxID=489913 RepID=A0A830GCG0_9EURY|nr:MULTISPECIES: ABC transporter ATP-binding protein [Halarchaeum]MBP2252472.1 energy-coupling factor transporter ATP-binding protein EcfA2 [Halarchaeum solikamskense]GGN20976.1 ABC transporter ATP-binding protein [Halarchaeum nitratireducens]